MNGQSLGLGGKQGNGIVAAISGPRGQEINAEDDITRKTVVRTSGGDRLSRETIALGIGALSVTLADVSNLAK